jgi:hypothetical protein
LCQQITDLGELWGDSEAKFYLTTEINIPVTGASTSPSDKPAGNIQDAKAG